MKDTELYRIPALYLTRSPNDLTIEFFKVPKSKHYNRYQEENKEKINGKRKSKQK